MSLQWMDILDGGPGPKRGDLIYTALKDRRGMRLRIVLWSRRIKRRDPGALPKYEIWAERWWHIEPETRIKLFESAERNGGQRDFYLNWYSRAPKKKQTFERYMRRAIP